jgi:phosphate transport system permease protein
MSTSNAQTAVAPPSISGKALHLQWRYLKDLGAKAAVWVGGLGVLAALMLIFVYLLIEVVPLFQPAHVQPRPVYAIPGDSGRTLYVSSEEQGEIGLRISESGQATFFDLHTGLPRLESGMPIGGRRLVSVFDSTPYKGLFAGALEDGSVLLARHQYRVSYPEDRRVIEPYLSYPYGESPVGFMPEAPRQLVVRDDSDLLLAGVDGQGQVHLRRYAKTSSFLSEDVTLEDAGGHVFTPVVQPDWLLMDPLQTWLYVIDAGRGRMAFYRLRGASEPELLQIEELGTAVVDARHIAGGLSVLISGADGVIQQWFPARREDQSWYPARIRTFRTPGTAPITTLGAEQRRRGFAVGDADGHVAIYYATSERRMHNARVSDAGITHLAFNPRANLLMALDAQGRLHAFDVHNEFPEVSWKALWGKVWYESHDYEKYLWQSSSASSDFEPKFSLTPLTVGTLKAAFYAMLFAAPLALLGAIYTANFMAPRMRQTVKPTVELMEALPTVILGFLAGLWLAPFVENNLAGVFLTLLVLPPAVPLFGFLWTRLPRGLRLWVPAGWEGALMIPVVALVVWLCFLFAHPVEALFFGGNMQAWMDREFGIGYDQRNALVVGVAMGVAVIPTIYSIAEDAIFNVPKHLTSGSLALGATPWQTLIGVVLPTASPGIFSALMIGLGRAVGETMIVLMATGNTPVMDFSIFSGMRTLSANVAVEMPESEVGSTHFRLLFLAGLVLFVLTFLFNTLAEVVRQRLRQKYASI